MRSSALSIASRVGSVWRGRAMYQMYQFTWEIRTDGCFVVYSDARAYWLGPSDCVWMVPGTWVED